LRWLEFGGWTALGFAGLELLSYGLHRWVFHGPLWKVHRTHHVRRHGAFEWNDLFSFGFALLAIGLLVAGLGDPVGSRAFPLGLGITLYGFAYFVIHDLYVHRRYLPFDSQNRLFRLLRRAHRRHHQSGEKPGQEPFGLFLFSYPEFLRTPGRGKLRAEPAKDEGSLVP